MIGLTIKSYFTILLAIGASSLLLFLLGLYFILFWNKQNKIAPNKKNHYEPMEVPQQTLQDLSAIAGDDVIATQLDLARALIETSKFSLAKEILLQVVGQGNSMQKMEAEQLLKSI